MLAETLDKMVDRIKKFRHLYDQNEMAVRDQIVNPILRDLGWDPENPEEVQPNVSTDEGIPDYTLLIGDKKALMIEAKNLSIDIEKREVITQLAKYCFGEGMKYGVLTNGSVWILFRSFEEGTTITERIVWRADIENDEKTASIRKLNTISRTNITQIDTLLEKRQILDEIWQAFVGKSDNLIQPLVSMLEGMIQEGYSDFDFGQGELEDFIGERVKELFSPAHESEVIPEPVNGHPPTVQGASRRIKIGSTTYNIKNSYEILTNVAEWLIGKSKLRREDCPIATGYKRYLVNTEPKHRYGDDYRASKRLSNGLYIETHMSTADCIIQARKLLQKFGHQGEILKVN